MTVKSTWNHEKPTWNHKKNMKTQLEPWITNLELWKKNCGASILGHHHHSHHYCKHNLRNKPNISSCVVFLMVNISAQDHFWSHPVWGANLQVYIMYFQDISAWCKNANKGHDHEYTVKDYPPSLPSSFWTYSTQMITFLHITKRILFIFTQDIAYHILYTGCFRITVKSKMRRIGPLFH